METKRLLVVDQIKGIAILLVVMGHIIQHNNLLGGTYNPVFEFISSFHMALFFMISGFLTAQKKSFIDGTFRGFCLYNRRKIITLAVPFLFWGLIIDHYFFAEKFQMLTVSQIVSYVKYPGDTWFLQKLFEVYVLYSIAKSFSCRIKNQRLSESVMIAISFALNMLLILTVSKMHYVSIMLFNVFFYTGYFIKRIGILEIAINNKWFFFIALVAFSILSTHWSYESLIIDKFLKIVISIAAFIILFNICQRIKWNGLVLKHISMWGSYSLAIYLIHFYFVWIYRDITWQADFNNMLFFLIVLIAAIPIVYVCILIAKIIETSAIANLIILGKTIKKNE